MLAFSFSVPASTSPTLESTIATRFLISSDRLLISPATVAKPLPCSPALAASMEAFRERMFVWSAMDTIRPMHFLISFKDNWKVSKVLCISSKWLATCRELFFSVSTSPCTWFTDSKILSFTNANWPDTVLMLEKVCSKSSREPLRSSESCSTVPKERRTMLSSCRESTSLWIRALR